MEFRREYNGCKSYGCSNCGEADMQRYSRSSRLGYDAWFCPLCGAYPPVLLNEPIVRLAKQIDHHHFQMMLEPCLCHRSLWRKRGFTSAGSQRVQCLQCGEMRTLLNATILSEKLQPMLKGLLAGIKPDMLQQYLGLTNKIFAKHLALLTQILRTFSRVMETNYNLQTLQIRSTIETARSGFRRQDHQRDATHLWTLSTACSETGYLFLITDNALLPTCALSDDVLEKASYQLDLEERPAQLSGNQDVLALARQRYETILSRSQFDQLAYCDKAHRYSKQATLLRPVYAAHAHMQNVRRLLTNKIGVDIVLEHESFLRGAAITALSTQVKQQKFRLYYCHVVPEKNGKEVAYVQQNKVSWWQELWVMTSLKTDYGQWQVGIGLLTGSNLANDRLAESLLPTHPNWNEQFWWQFHRWLALDYQVRLSLERVQQWQEIYRYLFNYVEPKQPRNPAANMVKVTSIDHLVETINTAFLSQERQIFCD
ncbi:hypothetical protein QNE51_004549 [Vibrio vulnificus]|nr:hypothetical protein [Vibrio vulnificus]EIF5016044.1 hypothetical protein [Vibrio vulnificus]EIF5019890.1 hypothetical protein [Vibrio vulnificus]EIO2322597.1 hypothetical protein [Vibrio vulnificus]EIO4068547.1 hypothetical protein [Vibrio vulnificus]